MPLFLDNRYILVNQLIKTFLLQYNIPLDDLRENVTKIILMVPTPGSNTKVWP